MTDAERIELDAMEARCKAHALAERELDRLYYLRLRAAGVCTWREVVDAIQEQIGPEPMPTEYPEWFRTMLPPAGPVEEETE